MTRVTLFALLVAGSIAGAPLVAQTPAPAAAAAPHAPAVQLPPPTPVAPPPATKIEKGYTSLFDGKTLDGWKIGGAPDTFKVVEGAIQANGYDGPGHLFYEGAVDNHEFRNFDLRVDVMAKAHANGGVYVLTEFQPTGFPGKGFEIQVNNSHTDRIRTGSLYHVVDLSYIPAKDDEWFPMEIQVKDQTITVWLKGAQVLQWTQPADWNGAYDTPGRKIAPGTFAFQAHDPNSYTYYANVRIKDIK